MAVGTVNQSNAALTQSLSANSPTSSSSAAGGAGSTGGVSGGSFMEMLALILGKILDQKQEELLQEAKSLPGADGGSAEGSSAEGSSAEGGSAEGSSASGDQSKVALFNANAKRLESLTSSLQQAMTAVANGTNTLSRAQ